MISGVTEYFKTPLPSGVNIRWARRQHAGVSYLVLVRTGCVGVARSARDQPDPPSQSPRLSEFKMCATATLFLLASLAVLGAQAMPVVDPPQNYSKPVNSTRPRAGTYGLDISSYVSVSDFECLKSNGYEFVIVRAYQSLGKLIEAFCSSSLFSSSLKTLTPAACCFHCRDARPQCCRKRQ